MTKILAIDDHESNLNMIRATMNRYLPNSLFFASLSGEEGIQIANKELPDTIILDVMMPELNGFEVCEILKKDPATRHIPIIFLTAYAKDSASFIKGLELGAEAFLTKPIEPSELVAQIKVMLRIKKAEDKLKLERDKYRIMAETLPDAVFTIDLNGIITYISPVTKALFGFEKNAILDNKNAFDLLFLKNSDKIRQFLNEVLLKSTIKDVDIPLYTKDNVEFIAELSASVINNDHQQAVEFIVVIRDISQRKKIETQILNYQQKLKSLNATLRKTEEKERKLIAEFLHDGVGQTLSLANINLTSLLAMDTSDIVTNVIEESSKLINQAISETRALTLDLSPPILFELGLIQAFKWKLNQLEDKYRFKTSFKSEETQIPISEDMRILLYRIFSELLLNIIKHAHADFVAVEILKRKYNLEISVQDNGIGFDPQLEALANIQNGFGLFSIKEKIDSVNGSIQIQSKVKEGTKILISIPLKKI